MVLPWWCTRFHYSHGASMGLSWCFHGTPMMLPRCFRGLSWGFHAAFMVVYALSWCFQVVYVLHGVFMVPPRFFWGASWIPRWCFHDGFGWFSIWFGFGLVVLRFTLFWFDFGGFVCFVLFFCLFSFVFEWCRVFLLLCDY